MLCGQCCSGVQKKVMVPWDVLCIFFQNVLDDSPIYLSSQSILLHLNPLMTMLLLVIVSLSFGDTSKFFRVVHALKCTPYFCRWSWNFHRSPVNMELQYGTSFLLVGLMESAFYCLFFFFGWSCFWRTLFITHLYHLYGDVIQFSEPNHSGFTWSLVLRNTKEDESLVWY